MQNNSILHRGMYLLIHGTTLVSTKVTSCRSAPLNTEWDEHFTVAFRRDLLFLRISSRSSPVISKTLGRIKAFKLTLPLYSESKIFQTPKEAGRLKKGKSLSSSHKSRDIKNIVITVYSRICRLLCRSWLSIFICYNIRCFCLICKPAILAIIRRQRSH